MPTTAPAEETWRTVAAAAALMATDRQARADAETSAARTVAEVECAAAVAVLRLPTPKQWILLGGAQHD